MNRSKWLIFMAFIACAAVSLAAPSPRPGSAQQNPVTLRSLYSLTPPSQLHRASTALLLVDFQREFLDGRLPLPDARAAIRNADELANWARRSGMLVVAVQNIVTRPGSPIFSPDSPASAFVPELAPKPHDLVLVKAMAGAFSKTNLDAELRGRGIDTLIIAGLMTHLAVLTTASDGTVLGYRVLVAADATATRALPGAAGGPSIDAHTLQRAALATMADRVADVLSNQAILKLQVIP